MKNRITDSFGLQKRFIERNSTATDIALINNQYYVIILIKIKLKVNIPV